MARKQTAGNRLRNALDAALERESKSVGRQLRWDEREAAHIEAACRAADHVELLQARLAEEAAVDNRANSIVRLTSEVRMQDRAVGEHLAYLQLAEFAPTPKSARHQAAVRVRWGAERKQRGAS